MRYAMINAPVRQYATFLSGLLSTAALSACEQPTALPPIAVASCPVTPTALTVAVGDTLRLVATPLDAEGERLRDVAVSWRSLSAGVAAVDAERGMVVGVGTGAAQITAQCGTRATAVTVTVVPRPVARLELSVPAVTMTELDTVQLAAVAFDDRGARAIAAPIRWLSGDATVATVDTTGRVIAMAPGTASVAASVGTVNASLVVRVTARPVASVVLNTSTFVLPRFESLTLNATARDVGGRLLPGRFPVWSSSAPGVATVSAAGTVAAVGVGTATVTAAVDGKSATATVTVVPPAPVTAVDITPVVGTVFVGQARVLTVTPRDAMGRALAGRTVAWASNAPATATVSGGTVTGVAPGSAVVTATVEGVVASATVSVLPVPVASVTVSLSSNTVRIGQFVTAVATLRDSVGGPIVGRTVAWTSSNIAAATVSSAGTIVGVTEGTATVTATVDGRSASAAVTVTAPPITSLQLEPLSPSVLLGGTTQLQATPYDSAGNPVVGRAIRWSTANATVATVDGQGMVSGVGLGTTQVYAEVGAITRSVYVTVRNSGAVWKVETTPASITLLPGQVQRIVPTVIDSYQLPVTNRPVTYQSSDVTVATVTSDGMVQAIGRGATTITVAVDGKTAVVRVAVIPTFGQPFAYVATSPSASGEQFCAIVRDGATYCAGSNWYGQLGNGTTTSSNTLVPVASSQRFTSVAVGSDHACSLTATGAAWCWGDNSAGQLGDSSTLSRLTPVAVAGGHRFTQLLAASDFTCGVTTAGTAQCWGTNNRSTLGVGGAVGFSTVPMPVAGGHRFSRLTATAYGSGVCGVTTAQYIMCWGESVPDGSSVSRATPVPVGDGRQFSHIILGSMRACALDLTTAIWCTTGSGSALRWQRRLGTYTELFGEGGGSYVCARKTSGGVHCAFGSDMTLDFTPDDLPATVSTLSIGPYSDLYVIDGAGRLMRWPQGYAGIEGPGPIFIVVP